MLERQRLPCPVSAEEGRESHLSRIRLQYQGTLYSISLGYYSAEPYGAASHWGPFLVGADGAFQVQAEQDFLWGPRDGHWPVSWLLELHLRFYSWSTASLTHAPAALRRTPEGSMLESANPEASG
jgi:hypothetical protein